MKLKLSRESVLPTAKFLLDTLAPSCERIEIAGSLRRQCPLVSDIELLAIPKYQGMIDLLDQTVRRLIWERVLDYRLNKRGSRVYGPSNKLLVFKHTNIALDIFSTDIARWPMSLVIRTGGKDTNLRLATAALALGMRLHACGSGYTLADGSPLVCYSEQDVFSALGLPFLRPEDRE